MYSTDSDHLSLSHSLRQFLLDCALLRLSCFFLPFAGLSVLAHSSGLSLLVGVPDCVWSSQFMFKGEIIRANCNLLVLSDLECSFNWVTKVSKSFWRCSLNSRFRLCSSGLNFYNRQTDKKRNKWINEWTSQYHQNWYEAYLEKLFFSRPHIVHQCRSTDNKDCAAISPQETRIQSSSIHQ